MPNSHFVIHFLQSLWTGNTFTIRVYICKALDPFKYPSYFPLGVKMQKKNIFLDPISPNLPTLFGKQDSG